ncbi:MAG: hypothetical protein PF568_04415, partial [Deltaproteobacteria bacterium]|jgi:hypothetical protein|nr:hypothetical protein [Deltaproteobacteria bacterium]
MTPLAMLQSLQLFINDLQIDLHLVIDLHLGIPGQDREQEIPRLIEQGPAQGRLRSPARLHEKSGSL